MKKKTIAIIPARGGSKRIPGKNIKKFAGKPIISYSILAAIESNLFDVVMVSTDSVEIANIAKAFGAEIPFYRSEQRSDDHATIEQVIEEVLLNYRDLGENFQSFCSILPTVPMLESELLKKSYYHFLENSYHSLIPVVQFSYPIQRALKMQNDNIVLVNPEHIHSRSQDLEPMFHDCGMFYWMKTKNFFVEKEILGENCGFVAVPESMVQDIDTPEDWKLAELKYSLLGK